MDQNFDQARQFIERYHIETVDLKFCDLWGRWHHLTIPASQFGPKLDEEGIGFDGSSVGLKSVKAGDMVLVPDLAQWVDYKREAEYNAVRNRPHPYEMSRYFDV